MKKFLVVTISFILFYSCKKTDTTDTSTVLQTNFTNVAYGTDPAQVMDIYLPPNRSSATSVMVLIHGGKWVSGDKSDFNSYVDSLQKRLPNYAIFNINYRLADTVTSANLFPAQENDVRSAIEFIYAKRAQYAISDKFVLFGQDAGAHLALLQAYKYTDPVNAKVVVDFFGPADMNAMFYAPSPLTDSFFIRKVIGYSPVDDSLLYAQSSPINFITSSSTPTIIFHGDSDLVVRHEQSDSLNARLDSSNVGAFTKVYKGQTHVFTTDTLSRSFDLMQTFLVTHVN